MNLQTILKAIWCLRNLRNGYYELNRRAKVEQELWDAANGKAPLPDQEKCRDLAVRLGVPDEFRLPRQE
jgi:hypothetical protein